MLPSLPPLNSAACSSFVLGGPPPERRYSPTLALDEAVTRIGGMSIARGTPPLGASPLGKRSPLKPTDDKPPMNEVYSPGYTALKNFVKENNGATLTPLYLELKDEEKIISPIVKGVFEIQLSNAHGIEDGRAFLGITFRKILRMVELGPFSKGGLAGFLPDLKRARCILNKCVQELSQCHEPIVDGDTDKDILFSAITKIKLRIAHIQTLINLITSATADSEPMSAEDAMAYWGSSGSPSGASASPAPFSAPRALSKLSRMATPTTSAGLEPSPRAEGTASSTDASRSRGASSSFGIGSPPPLPDVQSDVESAVIPPLRRRAPASPGQAQELGFLSTAIGGFTGDQGVRLLRATGGVLGRVSAPLTVEDIEDDSRGAV